MLLPFWSLEDWRISLRGWQAAKTVVACCLRSHHWELGDCQRVPAVHYQTDWKPAFTVWLPKGGTDRQTKRGTQQGGMLCPSSWRFSCIWQGAGLMVAEIALDTLFVGGGLYPQLWNNSSYWLQRIGWKKPTTDLIWETLFSPWPRQLIV